jgi:hypothetical protein
MTTVNGALILYKVSIAQSLVKRDFQALANILRLESNGHLDPLQILEYNTSLLPFENQDFSDHKDPYKKLVPC